MCQSGKIMVFIFKSTMFFSPRLQYFLLCIKHVVLANQGIRARDLIVFNAFKSTLNGNGMTIKKDPAIVNILYCVACVRCNVQQTNNCGCFVSLASQQHHNDNLSSI